ncbi:MAG TPA: DUF4430 domain-containing protein [Anaerovoracaceae bacterium]|nr:DUF4430 domain-containing protein [Anaerovoracaceae bacterium]
MMKITKGKIIAAAVICALLAASYIMGGGYAVKDGPPAEAAGAQTAAREKTDAVPAETDEVSVETRKVPGETEAVPGEAEAVPGEAGGEKAERGSSEQGGGRLSAEEKLALAESMGEGSSEGVEKGSKDYSRLQGMELDPGTGKDIYLTDPVPEGRPVPVEPEDAAISDRQLTCTLSVRCDTILNNMDALDPEKTELVPADGAIFATAKVTFYEGESVFNVLLREMKKNKIHMEFVNTPIYNSAYIEGINNLYEFDCGELSGWMFKVNGWFPNYGCSRYQLKEGDVVEWVYTCDLGRDVDGYYATGGE